MRFLLGLLAILVAVQCSTAYLVNTQKISKSFRRRSIHLIPVVGEWNAPRFADTITGRYLEASFERLLSAANVRTPYNKDHYRLSKLTDYHVEFSHAGFSALFTVKFEIVARSKFCKKACKQVCEAEVRGSALLMGDMTAEAITCHDDWELERLAKIVANSKLKVANAKREPHDASLEAFEEHIERHGRNYANDEEKQFRYAVFQRNMFKVQQLQATEQGSAVYGANHFFDWTDEEFKAHSTTPLWTKDSRMTEAQTPKIKAPAEWDWRDHNAVTEVKNQGQCGSCWAFSTTGNIEGQWAIKKKTLPDLSEQELLDCDRKDLACNGGLPSQAYKEIIRLGGLESEKKYPYEAHKETCQFKKSDARFYINGSVSISTNEDDMKKWLAKNGPISIGINANAMQWYFGGISHPWSIFCSKSKIDHGVLIVGYGEENGTAFWIVKNSWGPSWGEKGYYRVFRGAGVCGLNTMCTSAVVN